MRTHRSILASTVLLVAAACGATQEAAPPPPVAAAPAPFAYALNLGVADLAERSQDLVLAVENLLAKLENHDLAAAKVAYIEARAPYEEIEVLRASFPELHLAIDGRPSDFPGGEVDPDFGGFHAIELALWAREDHKSALPFALALYDDVQSLRGLLRGPLDLDAATTFATMATRTGEVASRTITSEEETWSEATLTVIRHNWIGVHSVYRHFAGAVRDRDGVVAEQLDRAYRRALEVIARDFPVGEVAGTPFALVDREKRRKIADASLAFRARLLDAARTIGVGQVDA
ncbi:MAG: EfeM/EfeO family lipoprotein [Planctomycetota bacterium]